MYGGGFATVPAYLRDMFGTRMSARSTGMLLTAWSAAGIFGPVLVNYIRQYNVDARHRQGAGLQRHDVSDGGVAGGRFLLQFASSSAVHERHHMKHDEADALGIAD